MATPLPSLQPRWLPSRGPIGAIGASPLPAVVVGPQPRLPEARPGLGFDAMDFVRFGAALAAAPRSAWLELGRAGMGDALLGGLRAFSGSAADWLGEAVAKGALAWRLLEGLPGLGPLLRTFSGIADNFFDSLAYELLGLRGDPGDPPRGDIRCAAELPSLERFGTGALNYTAFSALPSGTEIAVQIDWLLRALLPGVWMFADDSPPVSFSELEVNALPPSPYGAPFTRAHWDIDDAEVEDPSRVRPGRPYAKAWKLGARRIGVEVGFLRLASFYPCARPTGLMTLLHEGDGERYYAHIQVDPVDQDGNFLAGSARATARLTGLVGTGHEETWRYNWRSFMRDEDGRARISAARGSHALSVLEGPTRAGSTFKGWLATDFYPGPSVQGTHRATSIAIADDREEIISLYYGRQMLGFPRGKTMKWGNRGTLGIAGVGFGGTGYDLWRDDCEKLDALLAFPLLALPEPAAQGDACGFGRPHTCAPPTALPDDSEDDGDRAAAVRTTDGLVIGLPGSLDVMTHRLAGDGQRASASPPLVGSLLHRRTTPGEAFARDALRVVRRDLRT